MQMSRAGILRFFAPAEKCQCGQIPGLFFPGINVAGEEDVARMPISAQPGDETDEVTLCHRRAASGRARHAPSDVEEDGAPFVRRSRVGIVPDLDQPAIGEIVMPHFFLCEPGWRMFRIVDRDKLVVVGPG